MATRAITMTWRATPLRTLNSDRSTRTPLGTFRIIREDPSHHEPSQGFLLLLDGCEVGEFPTANAAEEAVRRLFIRCPSTAILEERLQCLTVALRPARSPPCG